jgi:hypothetical protein
VCVRERRGGRSSSHDSDQYQLEPCPRLQTRPRHFFYIYFIITLLGVWSGTSYRRIHFLPFTRDGRGFCPDILRLSLNLWNFILANSGSRCRGFYFSFFSLPFPLFLDLQSCAQEMMGRVLRKSGCLVSRWVGWGLDLLPLCESKLFPTVYYVMCAFREGVMGRAVNIMRALRKNCSVES